MRYLLFFARWASSLFLHVSLLLFVFSLSLVLVFDSESVKSNLVASGAYEDVVPAIIADNAKQTEGVVGAFPISDPVIQQFALESFSRDTLQKQTETAIDDVYAWLEGSKEKLQFNISLLESGQSFIERVSIYTATRLEQKPLCTTEDITQITVFELPCRPEDVPLSYIVQIARQNLENSAFFKNLEWSEQNLPKTKDGSSVAETYSYVPTIYRIFTEHIYLFVVLFVLALVLFVYVRRPLRKGTRALGKDLLSNSVTVIAATALFGFVLPRITQNASLQKSESTELFTTLSNSFVSSFNTLIINIMLQVFAVAVVILAIERMSRRTSVYGALQKKSGITSSRQPIIKQSSSPTSKHNPPVQTSEGKRKNKSPSKKSNKYRKMGL